MRIAFDENISRRLLDVILRLENDKSIELSSVHDGSPDPEWMFRFRDSGGIAMISGDHNILQQPINLAAYTESGLVSIWPPPGWPELRRWGQAALLLRWWPCIKLKISASSPGERWRLPMQWTPHIDGFKPIRDPRIDRR